MGEGRGDRVIPNAHAAHFDAVVEVVGVTERRPEGLIFVG